MEINDNSATKIFRGLAEILPLLNAKRCGFSSNSVGTEIQDRLAKPGVQGRGHFLAATLAEPIGMDFEGLVAVFVAHQTVPREEKRDAVGVDALGDRTINVNEIQMVRIDDDQIVFPGRLNPVFSDRLVKILLIEFAGETFFR